MKILVKQLGRLGDMICLSAIFPILKSEIYNLEIDVICSRHNNAVLNNNPFVNKTIMYHKTPMGIVKLLTNVKSSVYDFYFDPKDHYSSESNLLAKTVKAYVKVGFNSDKKIFDIPIDSSAKNKDLHYIQRALKAFSILGINQNFTRIPKPLLFPSCNSQTKIEQFVKNTFDNDIYCLLNISASNESRKLSVEKWINIIKNSKLMHSNIVISSVSEDYPKAKAIIENFGKAALYSSQSIEEVFCLVEKSAFVLTVDTAIVHIASAYNKPIIALYPAISDNFVKFAPLSDTQQIIFAEEGSNTLNSIPEELVISKINNFIEELL